MTFGDISAEDQSTTSQEVEQTEISVGGEAEATPNTSDETSKVNPAWEGIRSELGDVVFSRIAPHLKEFDSNHDRQISKLNEKYSWARDLESSGIGPDHVRAAVTLAKAMDETPEQVYERLGQFLQEQGRLPNSAAELEANTDDPEDEIDEDPQIAQLRQQQEEIAQVLYAQEQARISAEADKALDSEIEALKNDESLNLSKDDMREVLQRAVYLAQVEGKTLPLADVAKDYVENVRNRILSTPRPGQLAPRLVPTSGGNAAVAQQKSFGDMSREETQDLIASLVSGDRERS